MSFRECQERFGGRVCLCNSEREKKPMSSFQWHALNSCPLSGSAWPIASWTNFRRGKLISWSVEQPYWPSSLGKQRQAVGETTMFCKHRDTGSCSLELPCECQAHACTVPPYLLLHFLLHRIWGKKPPPPSS